MCRNVGGIKMGQGAFQRGRISGRLQYMLVTFDHEEPEENPAGKT